MRDALALLRSGKVLLSTVSGVASTNGRMISYFDQDVDAIDIITTKSYQVVPTDGNREPVICETETGCFGNSVGLRNCGMEMAAEELGALREKGMRALLNVSLSANSEENFVILVKKLSPYADMLELNFSCPHAAKGFGSSIGCDAAIASHYVETIRREVPGLKVPLFVKLTPNVPSIGRIAKAVMDAGADGLSLINTVGPIVHIDPESGKPILQNSLGGKGGKSGKWVYQVAEKALAETREAVGKDVPIIAMGGVADGVQVAHLVSLGANAVGIGSALALVNQREWPLYLQAMKDDAISLLKGEKARSASAHFLRQGRAMEYKRHIVTEVERYGNDISIIHVDGSLPSKAGEFVFLWLPQIGEKPFSVASTDPLSFVIKKRGTFTTELCKLKTGDELYVRGLYGAPLKTTKSVHALLVAGGSGVAVLPMLARQLALQGTKETILVGTSAHVEGKPLLFDELSPYGDFTQISDDGKPGRVLDLLDDMKIELDTEVYIIGPTKFMAIAAERLRKKGVPAGNIMLSMEKMTRCGVGLCGECVTGHRLTCQWGTFMEYGYLKDQEPEVLGL